MRALLDEQFSPQIEVMLRKAGSDRRGAERTPAWSCSRQHGRGPSRDRQAIEDVLSDNPDGLSAGERWIGPLKGQ